MKKRLVGFYDKKGRLVSIGREVNDRGSHSELNISLVSSDDLIKKDLDQETFKKEEAKLKTSAGLGNDRSSPVIE